MTKLTFPFLIVLTALCASCEEIPVIEKAEANYERSERSSVNFNYYEINIPVIFHVVSNGEPVGYGTNLSALDLERQIEILNLNFGQSTQRPNYNNHDLGVDTGIRFHLASLDPDGNKLKENGINRITSTQRNFGRNEAWDYAENHYWNPNSFLNVWIMDLANDGSSARMPLANPSSTLEGLVVAINENPPIYYTDGVVLEHSKLAEETQHVLTHEIGHYFGLYHTFHSKGCQTEDLLDADYCNDTFSYNRQDFNSTYTFKNRTSCSGISYVSTNYMDYRDGEFNTFTYNQTARMRLVLETSPWRKNLGRIETATGSKPDRDTNFEMVRRNYAQPEIIQN